MPERPASNPVRPHAVNCPAIVQMRRCRLGRTRTHALLPDSPAIDMGSNVLTLHSDQRGDGFPRVNGVRADIGAVEH
jgi:hypothetical protein